MNSGAWQRRTSAGRAVYYGRWEVGSAGTERLVPSCRGECPPPMPGIEDDSTLFVSRVKAVRPRVRMGAGAALSLQVSGGRCNRRLENGVGRDLAVAVTPRIATYADEESI